MTTVHVRMALGGLRLEFQGDETLFSRVIEPLVLHSASGRRRTDRAPREGRGGADAAVSRGAPPATRPRVPSYVPPSDRFGLFQRQLVDGEEDPASRIAAYAFFLWNYERKEVFAEDEILGCFQARGETPPADATDLYQELVERRMLAPGGNDHTWRLTSKGKAHVRHHLLSA